MYRIVIASFNGHAADWNALLALQTAYDKLVLKTTTLEQLAAEQGNKLIGVKALKDKDRDAAIAKAELIANGLRALASETKDVALKEQLRFSPSVLRDASALKLMKCFNRVREAANLHSGVIAGYGVDPQLLPEFFDSCDHLSEVLDSTRNAIVERAQQTAIMKELQKEIDVLLKESIDPLMKVVQVTHPDFYKHYKSARKIIDLKGKTKNDPVPVVPPANSGGPFNGTK